MPNPPQSIALHLGAHKTASTHLQKTLDNNAELLSQDGIRFFGPSYLRRQGRSLAAMFNLQGYEGPRPRRSAEQQLAFLAKGHRRLIFSEENFAGKLTDKNGRMELPLYPKTPSKLEELVALWAPLKPQIFLSVRNPVSHLTSVYSQSLFSAPQVGPRTFRARHNWRHLDWADYVDRIRQVSGLGEIFIWRQEDYAANQRPLFRRMLRWRTGGKVETINHRVHQGLSAPAVRATLQAANDGKSGDLASEARKAFPVGEKYKPFKLYAASTFAEADEIYADQMARISAMDGVHMLYSADHKADDVDKG